MKTIFTLAIIATISFSAYSQNNTVYFGIRSGELNGIECKVFYNEDRAVKATLDGKIYGIKASVFNEKYRSSFFHINPRFMTYRGFGAHAGLFDGYSYNLIDNNDDDLINPNIIYPVVGFDYVLGIEYRLKNFPFAFAAELSPYVDFFGPDFINLHPWNGCVSFKYVFDY
jgi:hypothetical protein